MQKQELGFWETLEDVHATLCESQEELAETCPNYQALSEITKKLKVLIENGAEQKRKREESA